MSALTNEACIKVVDTQLSLRSLLDDVNRLPTNPPSNPSLFLDFEGENLGRHGSISIVSLFVAPRNTVYLVDVHCLGGEAFTVTNNNVSFKTILESSTIPKVFFDVRNDSDALLNLYQVSLSGVKDIQLMELGCRPGPESSKKYVAGLAKCIAQSCALSDAQKEEWQRVKHNTARLFDHQKRGINHIFNIRPLEREIEQYCIQDVTVLPGLHDVYDKKLRRPGESFWQVQVQQATEERIKLSRTPHYDSQDKNKTLGPWSELEIEQAVEEWNEDVMFNAMHGDEAEDWDEDLLHDIMNGDCDDCDEYDDYQDTARDCIGWEEDMLKNGELF
jgi:exonuclease 3'-5' domain-containing protein 1